MGKETAIIPVELDGRETASGGEAVMDDGGEGVCFCVDKFFPLVGRVHQESTDGLDAFGLTELEGPVERIDDMTAHIAEGTCSEVEPASPIEGMIDGMKWTLRSRAEPEIPVEVRGDFGGIRGPWDTLRPDGTISPGVSLADWSDGVVPGPFTD